MMLPRIFNGAPKPAGLFFGLMALALSVPGSVVGEIEYNRDVRSILSENCFACHGPDEKGRKANLRLDTQAGATEDRDGVRAVVANDPEASALVRRILLDEDDEDVMPPVKSHKRLTAAQKETLVQWIKEGAAFQEHWAFVAPVKPERARGFPRRVDAERDRRVHAGASWRRWGCSRRRRRTGRR